MTAGRARTSTEVSAMAAEGRATVVTTRSELTSAASKVTARRAEAAPAREATHLRTATVTAATTTKGWLNCSGIAVFPHFDIATVPFVPVKLTDSVLSVLGVLEADDTGILGTAGRIGVDICSDDVTCESPDNQD